ncbi:MAG: glycosyltransferase family A protein [Bryobacteraceae bacterium]|jgi:glycosyltransferase involved in cell wall biosynthesis
MNFTIGIPTYNRAHLLPRAIDSVLEQQLPVDLVVLDDQSTDDTAAVARGYSRSVRYFAQERNSGLNAVRNRILNEAVNPWVFFLDDDDRLLPGSLQRMACAVASLPAGACHPVQFFCASNAFVPKDFLMLEAAGLMTGTVRGDLLPLINKERFHAGGFSYPEEIGGEGLLWLRVAQRNPIPTWNICVTEVGSDAPIRITSVEYQLRHARQFAELQDRYLAEFAELARRSAPWMEARRRLGSGLYWRLAGEPAHARSRMRQRWACNYWLPAAAVYALTWLPVSMGRMALRGYRRYA